MKTNIFIASLPRSGSTLLGYLLDRHSSVCHVGESFYWASSQLANKKCSCGKKDCSILIDLRKKLDHMDCYNFGSICAGIDSMDDPNKELHSLSLPSIYPPSKVTNYSLSMAADCLTRMSDTYRSIFKTPIILDNSKYIKLAEYLIKLNWKIIILTRDPRGLAFSNKVLCNRKKVVRPLYTKIPVYTSFGSQALYLLEKYNSSVIHVRYEDVCSESLLDSLGKLSDFMNVDNNFIYNPEPHILMGNRNLISKSSHKIVENLEWKVGMNQEELKLLQNNQLIEVYKKLKYELKV